MFVNYAFTVKCNTHGHYPTMADYKEWILHAQSKGVDVEAYYYEIDSKDRLHIHGVFSGPKNLYKRGLLFKSFHQRIDEIPSFLDLQHWADYITKDYVNDFEYNQKLLAYEYRHLPHEDLYFSSPKETLKNK